MPPPFQLAMRPSWPLVLLAAVLCAGCERPKPKVVPAEAVKVRAARTTTEVVTEIEEFTGRTAAVNTVEVRSRVSGYLDEVLFKDGAEVKQGELLFVVDDRSFKSLAESAAAVVAQSQARLDRLSGQYRRAKALVATKAVTEEQFEQISFDKAEAQANLTAAQAAQKLADLNVEYTRVTAPLSGTISHRRVDPGNLIKADETAMATIVSLDPIYAYFDINERTVLHLRRLIEQGKIESATKSQLKVAISLADEEVPSHEGTIDFVDNQIDPSTGSLRVRAEIQNPKRLLSPGLFVRLRFPVGEPHPALLVAEEALVTDQGQRFVYIIDKDDKAAYRRVTIGMLVNGKRVIEQGLQPHDRVIVEGLQRVKEGSKVVVMKEAASSPGLTPTAASEKQVLPAGTTPNEGSAFPVAPIKDQEKAGP